MLGRAVTEYTKAIESLLDDADRIEYLSAHLAAIDAARWDDAQLLDLTVYNPDTMDAATMRG